jgi:hypothetical protein
LQQNSISNFTLQETKAINTQSQSFERISVPSYSLLLHCYSHTFLFYTLLESAAAAAAASTDTDTTSEIDTCTTTTISDTSSLSSIRPPTTPFLEDNGIKEPIHHLYLTIQTAADQLYTLAIVIIECFFFSTNPPIYASSSV